MRRAENETARKGYNAFDYLHLPRLLDPSGRCCLRP